MNVDIFTLFPQWFDWCASSATSRTRSPPARARVRRLPRLHAADRRPGRRHAVRRRRRHGAARRRARRGPARALRDRPGRRCAAAARDRAGAGRAAARRGARRRARRGARPDVAVRPLRGLRRADRRALRQRRDLDRPLRAGGGRAGGDGALRRGRAQAAGRARHERSAAEESFSAALDGRPSTRTTRARPSTAAGRCRRCCSRATTPRSSAGGWSAAASAARGRRAEPGAPTPARGRRRGRRGADVRDHWPAARGLRYHATGSRTRGLPRTPPRLLPL